MILALILVLINIRIFMAMKKTQPIKAAEPVEAVEAVKASLTPSLIAILRIARESKDIPLWFTHLVNALSVSRRFKDRGKPE